MNEQQNRTIVIDKGSKLVFSRRARGGERKDIDEGD